MKTYTVTKGGDRLLTTFNKQEAEVKLAEMLKYSSQWYICEQGIDFPDKLYDDNGKLKPECDLPIIPEV